ncbi:HIT family protein [Nocardia donostiensis]|uniref:HIT family protein n=1 Tax=Nocardia donostiensis TaxID=1538463 RepID=A0A1W0B570_9NOCA|nr:HIT family protein [Nocardia donostiensis]ONM46995.1 HIT family protein [Nocardia donostiensis]OQS14633.1 HIT family protein [Nocardia donostiensis]OQS17667.1 HIT family protein [Nocardia donostiensis]
MNDCVFCRIVAGSAPAAKVYEDDTVCAFLDIRPITRGHTLVIPKTHAGELQDLDAETGAHVFQVGHRLALAIRRGEPAGSPVRADGANLVLNDGSAAFQTVGHVHLHVIPRKHGDTLRLAAGFLLRRPHDPETTAAAIRAGLALLDTEPDTDNEQPPPEKGSRR